MWLQSCGRTAGPRRLHSGLCLLWPACTGTGAWCRQTAATSSNFQKNNVLLAELEQNLLKHEHRASAPQDGKGLPSKQGVGNPRHGCSKQGFDCTLRRRKNNQSLWLSAENSCLTHTELLRASTVIACISSTQEGGAHST